MRHLNVKKSKRILLFLSFRANSYIDYIDDYGIFEEETKKINEIHESEGMEGLAKFVMTDCKLLSLSVTCRHDICKYIKYKNNVKKEDCSQIEGESLACLHHALSDLQFCVAI